MNILITGGAGFLGSHLSESFLARGDHVVALDIADTTKIEHLLGNPKFEFIRESFMEEGVLDPLVQRADLVYHLGAVVGVEHYVSDPSKVLEVNVNGTQNVLRQAWRHKKRVVFSSTSEVYGRNPKVPFHEDDERVLGSTRIDRWCYSTSKAVGEHFCFAYRNRGLPVTIVRYFNIYGPRLDAVDAGRVVTIFMGQILSGKDVTVIGDGSQTRCFTYVSDAVHATMQAGLLPEAEGEIFNIGTDFELSILDLAKLMIELSGATSKIRFIEQEERYGPRYEDVPRRVPDNTKMRKVLGTEIRVGVREGLEQTIDWFRKTATPCP